MPTELVRTAACIAGTAAVAAVATPVALGVLGFSTGGVVAGSIAAGMQSGIGNVAAGSLFAMAQAAGTAPIVTGLHAGVAAGAAGGAKIALTKVLPLIR
ncbi:hypothetical protein CPB86DRAFT_782166 [Serendipita vermifera]|nr:hypothetical protein CPB86DRAFT_782166 [Serendipita vermifera]